MKQDLVQADNYVLRAIVRSVRSLSLSDEVSAAVINYQNTRFAAVRGRTRPYNRTRPYDRTPRRQRS